jgi:hypothetical protein
MATVTKKSKSYKYLDTDSTVSIGSSADRYNTFLKSGNIYPYLRKGLVVKDDITPEHLINTFQLDAVAFGNWVTMWDRINYTNALFIALYDLNKVLGFNGNIGIKKNLTITVGDRGIPNSAAHYSPSRMLININRYSRTTVDEKLEAFLSSGGIHSLAHEYGHFLDYFAGSVLEPQTAHFAASGGHSLSKSPMGYKSPIRSLFDEILDKQILTRNGKQTEYYNNLVKTDGYGDYWRRRTEIFARAFESWVSFELQQQGINNKLLTYKSYISMVYPSNGIVRECAPLFRKLAKAIGDRIK